MPTNRATVYRPAGHDQRVRIDMPFMQGARLWLRDICGPGTRPEFHYSDNTWRVVRKYERVVIEALAQRFGKVHVIHDYNLTEKCAPACVNAVGDECVCSCEAKNHGAGTIQGSHWINHRAVVISDSLTIQNTIKRVRYVVRPPGVQGLKRKRAS